MLIADSLLQQHKLDPLTGIITDPDILSQEVFPPTTIDPTDLCATLLSTQITRNPDFDFFPSLPSMVTSPLASQKIPPILLTTVPPSFKVSTVSVESLSTTQQPLRKVLPDQLRWMDLFLCYFPSVEEKPISIYQRRSTHPPHTTRCVQHNTPKRIHPLPSA